MSSAAMGKKWMCWASRGSSPGTGGKSSGLESMESTMYQREGGPFNWHSVDRIRGARALLTLRELQVLRDIRLELPYRKARRSAAVVRPTSVRTHILEDTSESAAVAEEL